MRRDDHRTTSTTRTIAAREARRERPALRRELPVGLRLRPANASRSAVRLARPALLARHGHIRRTPPLDAPGGPELERRARASCDGSSNTRPLQRQVSPPEPPQLHTSRSPPATPRAIGCDCEPKQNLGAANASPATTSCSLLLVHQAGVATSAYTAQPAQLSWKALARTWARPATSTDAHLWRAAHSPFSSLFDNVQTNSRAAARTDRRSSLISDPNAPAKFTQRA